MSSKENLKISISQCKASRGFLGWSQKDLAKMVGCAEKTISDFEKGNREAQARTLKDIRTTFENEGIIFEENDEFLTVRLKK